MPVKRFAFLPWLVFFLTTLVLVFVFLLISLPQIAKILGVVITITLVILMRFWLYQLKKGQSFSRVPLNTNDWHELASLIPWFSSISEEEKTQVVHRIGLQMGALTVQNPEGVILENRSAKSVAMVLGLFCLVVLEVKDETPICTVVLRKDGALLKTSDRIEVTWDQVWNRIQNIAKTDLRFLALT